MNEVNVICHANRLPVRLLAGKNFSTRHPGGTWPTVDLSCFGCHRLFLTNAPQEKSAVTLRLLSAHSLLSVKLLLVKVTCGWGPTAAPPWLVSLVTGHGDHPRLFTVPPLAYISGTSSCPAYPGLSLFPNILPSLPFSACGRLWYFYPWTSLCFYTLTRSSHLLPQFQIHWLSQSWCSHPSTSPKL